MEFWKLLDVLENVSVEQAAIQAKHCAINLLSQLKIACKGNLNRVVKVIKLGGFVCCTDNFTQQPEVINGASNFVVDIFGGRNRSTLTICSWNKFITKRDLC